jgi:L-fuculose-phosphate aldolase
MPSPPLPKLRAEVVKVSRRLHTMGWVANHDGNVSVRLTGKRLLITPTAVSKLDVDDSMLLVVDEKGVVLEGRRKAFSELELHLAVYRARPEVECVLHAHPPHATAFGLVGVELAPVAMPEVVVSLGDSIPTVPRLMPKTPELVKAVEAAAGRVDAMLLAGNGALTMGDSLEQALLRLELVEHYARILSVARGLGPVPALPAGDVTKLLEARAKAGLGPKPKS